MGDPEFPYLKQDKEHFEALWEATGKSCIRTVLVFA